MAYKAEISWKGRTADGTRREVFAHRVGPRWEFFERERRFDVWQPLDQPPLEDWQALLDAVRRRIARRLLRPEEEARVEGMISERFPGAKP